MDHTPALCTARAAAIFGQFRIRTCVRAMEFFGVEPLTPFLQKLNDFYVRPKDISSFKPIFIFFFGT